VKFGKLIESRGFDKIVKGETTYWRGIKLSSVVYLMILFLVIGVGVGRYWWGSVSSEWLALSEERVEELNLVASHQEAYINGLHEEFVDLTEAYNKAIETKIPEPTKVEYITVEKIKYVKYADYVNLWNYMDEIVKSYIKKYQDTFAAYAVLLDTKDQIIGEQDRQIRILKKKSSPWFQVTGGVTAVYDPFNRAGHAGFGVTAGINLIKFSKKLVKFFKIIF
jgi:hypothetical protein